MATEHTITFLPFHDGQKKFIARRPKESDPRRAPIW